MFLVNYLTMNKILSDETCAGFRRLPCSFNDMVRAIYTAGYTEGHKSNYEIVKLTEKKLFKQKKVQKEI